MNETAAALLKRWKELNKEKINFYNAHNGLPWTDEISAAWVSLTNDWENTFYQYTAAMSGKTLEEVRAVANEVMSSRFD